MSKRVMRHQVGDMIAFGGLRPEELAPCRNVEEEVANLELGAFREGDVADLKYSTTVNLYFGSGQISGRLSAEADARDRGNRCERLAAEAEGQNAGELFWRLEFACSVSLEGEQGIIPDHAFAVV